MKFWYWVKQVGKKIGLIFIIWMKNSVAPNMLAFDEGSWSASNEVIDFSLKLYVQLSH